MRVKRLVVAVMCTVLPVLSSQAQEDFHPADYTLVWGDEFNEGDQLNDNWQAEWQDRGWVNEELQFYRPGTELIDGRRTTEVSDGNLKINCFKASDGNVYSARVNAKNNWQGWTYGYFVARIKLPKGRGTWPAFWMMPMEVDWSVEDAWPKCGEMDIMEEVGNEPNNVKSSLHAIGHYWKVGSEVSNGMYCNGAEDDFHVYAMKWTPQNITTYVDGQVLLSYDNPNTGDDNWPYHVPFHLILNVAWGGSWGADKGVFEEDLPVQMLVDYVRVYQQVDNPSGNGGSGSGYERMNDDGSGNAYIIGSYNCVGVDSYDHNENYAWEGNIIPMKSDGKIHTIDLTAGKNINPLYVNFKIYPSPDDFANPERGDGFTTNGSKYRCTMEDNAWFMLGTGSNGVDNGNIALKPGVQLPEGTTYTFTLDCSNGTENAVIRAGERKVPVDGIWIIGAEGSIGKTSFGWGDDWHPENAIEMKKVADGIYEHEFRVGRTLNPQNVNFKFYPQPGWGEEFLATPNNYNLVIDSDVFGLGTEDWRNGNVYLRDGVTLVDNDVYIFRVVVTNGANHGSLIVQKKEKNTAVNGVWIIGSEGSIGKTSYGGGDAWHEEDAIEMTKVSDGVFEYEFVVGQTLNPENVNFKFYPQKGWGDEFMGTESDYTVTTTDEVFGIGLNDGHDDGNVYLKAPGTLRNGDIYVFRIDATGGSQHAVMTVTRKVSENYNYPDPGKSMLGKVVVAYVTSYTDVIPDPTKMTHINYAFGGVGNDFRSVYVDNPERLKTIVNLKQQNPKLRILLSVGGWGKGNFSEMAASADNRKAFAESCANFCRDYNIDGIDIDWEYPTSNVGGISASPDDRQNYTYLMSDLRDALGKEKLLTLAVPCDDKDYYDFESFIDYVNYVNVMAYDMGANGAHHAALYKSDEAGKAWCTADQAVKNHLSQGVPANKMVLGIPFYANGGENGQISYAELKNRLNSGEYVDHWDNVAKVPYATDIYGTWKYGYDDERSLNAKCEYVFTEKLLGAMYWEYNHDDSYGVLRNTVANALMGYSEPASVDRLWIIGSTKSVGKNGFTYDDRWDASNALEMNKNGNVYTYVFTVGKDLNKDFVDFKIFTQAGWGNDFKGVRNSPYRITSKSDLFAVSDGTDGRRDGSIYLRNGQTLGEGKEVVVTIDCSKSYGNAVLTTTVRDAITGIRSVEQSNSDNSRAYDLSGRTLNNIPSKQIYIKNNKKLIRR